MNNDQNILEINEAEFNEKVVEASDNQLMVVDFGRLGVDLVNN